MVCLTAVLQLTAQKVVINGLVKNDNGEPLPYAYIIDSMTSTGTITNNSGYFSFSMNPSNIQVLTASHVSSVSSTKTFTTSKDTFIVFNLGPLNIEEITVKGTPLARQAMTGANFLDHKTIMNIPTFFGEHDIMRAMTTLPGIAGGVEDFTAFYVRGGNRDQNLFLVDGTRLFSTSHFGGMVSMFNPDLIRHIDIYKGGAPARYGDGLSSVMDISLREGGNKGNKARIDIGNLRSGLLFEGKIGGKANYLLAGRIGYKTLFYRGLQFPKAIKDETMMGEFQNFTFYDLDAKVGFHPNKRTNLFLNIHLGSDLQNYLIRSEYGDTLSALKTFNKLNQKWYYNIHNNIITLGSKTVISPGIALKNTLWNTNYGNNRTYVETAFDSSNELDIYKSSQNNFINDFSDKIELLIGKINKHSLITGGQISYYETSSGRFQKTELKTGVDSLWGEPNHNALETSLFIEDDYQPFSGFFINAGLRATNLSASDTTYQRIQPRVNLRYRIRENLSMKAGLAVTDQAFHSMVEINSYNEAESWLLANKQILPQHAWQTSAGIYGNIANTRIEYSIETYYKRMKDLLYLPAQIGFPQLMEYVQKNGIGESYGTEFLIKKDGGKINWAIAYTLAWSNRKFSSINDGEWFASDFDRRHDFNFSFNYYLNKANTLNFNYLLQSGRPFTMPLAYVPPGELYFGLNGYRVYDGLNNVRAPWTRRFDCAYTRRGYIINGRKYSFTISVMNLFGHVNPNAMYASNNKVYLRSSYRTLISGLFTLQLFQERNPDNNQ